MNPIKILLNLSLILLCIPAWGKDPIQSEVTVTKSYEPQLDNRIQKIPFSAVIPDSMKVKPKIQFTPKHILVTPGKFDPRYNDGISIQEEPIQTLSKTLWEANLGLGTLINPYAHLQGVGTDSRLGTWTVNALHASAHRSLNRFNGLNSPNHQSITQLDGQSEWVLKNKYKISAQIGYENKYNIVYGYSDTLLADLPYQSTHLMYGNARFENLSANASDWMYQMNVNTYRWSDAYNNSESVWGVNGFIEKRTSKDDRMGIKVEWNQLFQHLFSGDKINSVLQVTPYYTRRIDQLMVSGELKLVYDNRSSTHIFPYINAKVSYDMTDDQIACPFVSIEGDHQVNTMSALTQSNPYLSPAIDHPINTAYRIGVRYGIEGKMGGSFSYHLSQAFKSIHDAAFFLNLNTEADGSEGFFMMRFDNVRVQETLLEASYLILPELHADGRLCYRGYRMNSLEHPYQLPAVESKITLTYSLLDKLKLALTGHYYGDFYGNEANSQLTEVSVPSSFNLSLQGIYQCYQNTRLWITMENLLNQDIYQFYRYKDYGIHLQVGIGFHF